MRCRFTLRWLVAVVALAAAADPASASSPDAVARESASAAPDPADDPRLARTGPAEQGFRKLEDGVLWRPFFFVQLVAGAAVLPLAIPIAWAVADWEDAIDICITGPYGMVFERPLGE